MPHRRLAHRLLGEWLRTGDTYVRSADGYYTCLGRSGDLLKAGGIWVSPAEVEDRLLQHPSVAEAAVVGVRDRDDLDKPVACVVPVPGATLTEVELVAWCREGLAAFKRPRSVLVLSELPKTATGKVQRFRLREDAQAAAAPDPRAAPERPGQRAVALGGRWVCRGTCARTGSPLPGSAHVRRAVSAHVPGPGARSPDRHMCADSLGTCARTGSPLPGSAHVPGLSRHMCPGCLARRPRAYAGGRIRQLSAPAARPSPASSPSARDDPATARSRSPAAPARPGCALSGRRRAPGAARSRPTSARLVQLHVRPLDTCRSARKLPHGRMQG